MNQEDITMQKVTKKFTFTISILILLLQGCGSSNSTTTYATTLGDGVSIGTTDKDAVMIPNTNTAKEISQEVSSILKTHITDYNEKEALDLSKTTNYCDVSGLRESQGTGTDESVNSNQTYEYCQQDENLQHGKINLDYTEMNEEGKYPKSLDLKISEDYTFNHTALKKDLIVNSNISYNSNNSIKQIEVKINGKIQYNDINYSLQNISQTIEY